MKLLTYRYELNDNISVDRVLYMRILFNSHFL